MKKTGPGEGVLMAFCVWLAAVAGCGKQQITLIRQMDSDTDIVMDSSSHSEGPWDTDTPTGSSGVDSDSLATDTNRSEDTTDTEDNRLCQLSDFRIRITEIDVGEPVVASSDEANLKPIAISPIKGGGSRLAWMGEENTVHVTTLNEADEIVQNTLAFPAHDFQDLYATPDGGVLLLTRDATGGGTLNCGNENNLCVMPETPIPCFDMYMAGFDGEGETWATRLTGSSETVPPYSTAKDGPSVTMIWWYAHHGRIASNGNTFAAYFGSAISVSTGSCINIHQGDRMQIVSERGELQEGGFGWGCSPSGYEQIIWNSAAHAYVSVCKSENAASGIVAFAPDEAVIRNIDLWYSNIGELVLAPNGGYWLALSDRKPGQPERSDGLAEVHLLQFTSDGVEKQQTVQSAANINARAPHLASLGDGSLVLLYETSALAGETDGETDSDPARQTIVEQRSMTDGVLIGAPVTVPNFTSNRYHALRSFDDGSVAMAAKGSSATTIQILRVLPCANR